MDTTRKVLLGAVAVVAATALGFAVTGPGADSAGSEVSRPTPSSSTSTTAQNVRAQGSATNYQGMAYGQREFAATSDKSQTKLWYAKDRWWAVMTRPGGTSSIFELDPDTNNWVDTRIPVDARSKTYADAVYDGKHLYIATRTSSGLLAVSKYLPGDDKVPWRLQAGFPVTIAQGGARSLSIAVDSRDRVWAAFNQGRRIWVAASAPGGAKWSAATPITKPNSVNDDDTAAMVASRGRIAMMWSDQVQGAFWWAEHEDSDGSTTMKTSPQPVKSGLRIADGHIRLLASRSGRVYAAVKTSLGDARSDPPNSPLLMVLYHDPGQTTWNASVAAVTTDQMTRPQIVLSQDEKRLYFIASHDQHGGQLYLKIADTAQMRFGSGLGTLLLGWPGAVINNATVSRQPVDAKTGLLVLAADSSQARYYYARLPLTG